jgi:hypothetical protein
MPNLATGSGFLGLISEDLIRLSPPLQKGSGSTLDGAAIKTCLIVESTRLYTCQIVDCLRWSAFL